MKFTPTVLGDGRINLKVAPEVSELNTQGIGITLAGSSGATAIMPSFTTRKAATTVQLYDGQTFAIGGLIKNNVTTNMKAFPILGEIPVLGALFRSSDFQTDKTELVFVVTPRLVKPLPPNYSLPTDSYTPPSRSDFFLNGKMEAYAPNGTNTGADATATVRRLRSEIGDRNAEDYAFRNSAPDFKFSLCMLESHAQSRSEIGESVTMMRAQQTINPEASLNSDPVLGQDGKTAKGALDNYYDTFRKPPAEASSTFTLGVGNSKIAACVEVMSHARRHRTKSANWRNRYHRRIVDFVLIGFAGLVLDLGRLYVNKTELQNAADACALAQHVI